MSLISSLICRLSHRRNTIKKKILHALRQPSVTVRPGSLSAMYSERAQLEETIRTLRQVNEINFRGRRF